MGSSGVYQMHLDKLCKGKKLIRGLKTVGGAGFLRAYWKKSLTKWGFFISST
jgi:hypothetical protein